MSWVCTSDDLVKAREDEEDLELREEEKDSGQEVDDNQLADEEELLNENGEHIFN